MPTPLPRVDALPDHLDCRGCAEGINYCRRPCWPVPHEVRALVNAGLANKLMVDHWGGDPRKPKELAGDPNDGIILIVCPASPGHEAREAPGQPDEVMGFMGGGLVGMMMAQPMMLAAVRSGCVFLGVDKLCALHDRGLKPSEGRKSCCKNPPDHAYAIHVGVALEWATELGQEVAREWADAAGFNLEEYLERAAGFRYL